MGALAEHELESTVRMSAGTDGRFYFKTILTLALLLRVGVVLLLLKGHPGNWLFSRVLDLGYLAQSLNSGQGLSSPFGGSTGPTAFVAPGYPALLALIFHLFGSYSSASAEVLLGLQILFSVLTVAVILRVARRLFGAPTANIAGAIWAVSLPLVSLPTVPWDTCLSVLLLIGMFDLAIRCVENPTKGLWAFMGAYCALTMLINPSLMLAFLAILGWTIYHTRSSRRFDKLMCLLLFLAIFAPWPVRNARVLHAIIPLRSNFGYEMWQGNHAGATGVFDPTLQPLGNKREYMEYASQGEVAYMRHKSAQAEGYIRAHPGEFFRLSAERVGRFWTGAGGEVNSKMFVLHAVLTSLLGFLGLAALCKQRSSLAMLFFLPLLLFPLPYYITHPDFRFRALVDPLLTILSAYAVTQITNGYRQKST
jgi:Dolichyl-phosphate-mannose-protein mannosyltransferase